MNILFVHEVDWLRKVVYEIHTLSELLSLREHQVYAIDYESMWQKNSLFDFGSLRTTTATNVARSCQGASVSLIRPGFIKLPGLSRLSAAFTHNLEIKKTIREKRIDVIILYSVPTNGLQTLRQARMAGIPVIYRALDISNELVPYPVLRPITRLLERKVYSGADLVLSLSPKLSEYIISMGAPEKKVKLLLLGIDTKAFRPDGDSGELRREWGLGENEPVIVFIGTIFDFAGLDTFIRSFPAIAREVPGAKVLIVGDGPHRSKLHGIIAELGLQEQVLITGFQPYEMMPRYINLATLCVNPFLITDATRHIFPTKIIQYLACGKATVATPLPGMTSVAPGKGEGIVYANNPGNMASEIVSLLKSPEERRRLGQAGLNYVRQTHSYDKIAQQLERILQEVTGRREAG